MLYALFNFRHLKTSLLLSVAGLLVAGYANGADSYDAAVAHTGRSESDVKRDSMEHPAELLRLAGIKSGMRVADVLSVDGYYSELASYLTGPTGGVFIINNAAFDRWSDGALQRRLQPGRLANVRHETVDLDRMNLEPSSMDAILMIRIYHDLYWVDHAGIWPRIDTKSVLDQIVRAMKPGGVLLLVDNSASPGTGISAASALHRIDEDYAIKDFESRGLTVVAKSDLLRRLDDTRDQKSNTGPTLGKTDRFVLVLRKTVH